jgi:hypothetical protein
MQEGLIYFTQYYYLRGFFQFKILLIRIRRKFKHRWLMHTSQFLITLSIYKVNKRENKSKRALQIIGHVVAEFYANKRLMHERRQF